MPHAERLKLVKAHAYGNDFLLTTGALPSGSDPSSLARAVCDRHLGVGADGLIVIEPTKKGARMSLYNPDGSRPELSGNGVRCIGAWLAVTHDLQPGAEVVVDTDAGERPMRVISREGNRVVFRTGMGVPQGIRAVELPVGGSTVPAVVMNVGNPQCIVLGPATPERLNTLGPVLAVHPFFRDGTNVAFVEVTRPDHIRILIWERGVGPTMSSGTGTCASAVAAASHGGAERSVIVEAPGGSQRVEWLDEGLWLSGWAEVVATLEWYGQ